VSSGDEQTRPLIKICGVTRVEDAVAALELEVDFVGLNFWQRSPRRVDPVAAAEIARARRGRTRLVGVFVDAPIQEIEFRSRELGLDAVQLHGDETPAMARQLATPHWRAFRTFPSVEAFAEWGRAETVVVNAGARSSYGGSGRSWNHEALRDLPRDGRAILVAGGITPENVRAALAASGADGIDVASGVERSPGVKDHDRMRALVEEARRGTT